MEPTKRGLQAMPSLHHVALQAMPFLYHVTVQANRMRCLPSCPAAVEAGTVESTKRDYGPIMAQFVLPGKPSGARVWALARGWPC